MSAFTASTEAEAKGTEDNSSAPIGLLPKTKSSFAEDCLQNVQNLEALVDIIAKHFNKLIPASVSRVVFLNTSKTLVVCFCNQQRKLSASTKMRTKRMTTFSTSQSLVDIVGKKKRVGIHLASAGIVGKALISGRVTTSKLLKEEKDETSEFAELLADSDNFSSMTVLPIRSLEYSNVLLNEVGERKDGDVPVTTVGAVILVNSTTRKEVSDHLSGNSDAIITNPDVQHALRVASLALTNAIEADHKSIQLNKAKNAREFQATVGKHLKSESDLTTAAELFRNMIRADVAWIYRLVPNYNFGGVDQMELKRQDELQYESRDHTIQMPSSVLSAASKLRTNRRRHSLEVKSVVVQCVTKGRPLNYRNASSIPSCFRELDVYSEYMKVGDKLRDAAFDAQAETFVSLSRASNRGDLKNSEWEDLDAVALMCVPIVDEDEVTVGAVELIRPATEFGDDDMELAALFAQQIAAVLRATKLEKQKAVYIRKVEVLFKVTKMVKNIKDMHVVLDKLLELVRELLNADQAQIFLQDEIKGSLVCQVSSTGWPIPEHADRSGNAHPAEFLLSQHSMETDKGMLIKDCSDFVNHELGAGSQSPAESEENSFCYGLKSVAGIMVPISMLSGRNVGTIFASNFSHKQFHQEDLELLDAFRQELRGAVARISLEATVGAGLHADSDLIESSGEIDKQSEASLKGVSGDGQGVASLLELFTNDSNKKLKSRRRRRSSMTRSRNSSVMKNVRLDLKGTSDENLVNWAFDPFECGGRSVLYANFVRMFDLAGIAIRFNLNAATLKCFAQGIAEQYQDNPYHNFEHAFSTAHFCFVSILKCKQITGMLRSIDVFAMLIAALMHDADHGGVNNGYLIKTRSPLAVRYNDVSVLENHHAAVGWEVIWGYKERFEGQLQTANIVEKLSAEDMITFRKTTIKAILHTDMVHHFDIIQKLSGLDPASPFDVNEPSDRESLVGTLVHAADISNPLLPDFNLVEKWVSFFFCPLLSEFNIQVPFTCLYVALLTYLGFFPAE